MSDLFGNHIVGFPTRRLNYSHFFLERPHCGDKSVLNLKSKKKLYLLKSKQKNFKVFPYLIEAFPVSFASASNDKKSNPQSRFTSS